MGETKVDAKLVDSRIKKMEEMFKSTTDETINLIAISNNRSSSVAPFYIEKCRSFLKDKTADVLISEFIERSHGDWERIQNKDMKLLSEIHKFLFECNDEEINFINTMIKQTMTTLISNTNSEERELLWEMIHDHVDISVSYITHKRKIEKEFMIHVNLTSWKST